jgi:nucleotide-binding universal stress UspA family protein
MTPNPTRRSGPPSTPPHRLVLLVGIDLTEVSEHLLMTTRRLIGSGEDVVLHVVHVVHKESLQTRLNEPITSPPTDSAESVGHVAAARFELEALCRRVVDGSKAEVIVHTPVGDPSDELARIAREIGASIVVVEAHDRPWRARLFHRSVAARIGREAPCSVLTVR